MLNFFIKIWIVQNQKEILAYSLTKKDITPLLKGNISNIYVNNDKLIAISININEKSEFEISIFEAFVLHNYYDTQHMRNIYFRNLGSKFHYAS